MEEEMVPPAEQAAPQEGAPDAQSQFVELVGNISQGMQMLMQVLQGVSPEAAEKLGSVAKAFGETMDQVVSQSQGAGPQQQPSEAPMESGGNPNARPLGPQG